MTTRPGISRPDWDTFYLGIAQAASARGDCIRRKVGAVLVKGRRTSLGYNGSEPGGPSCLEGECPRCLDDSIPSGTGYENCIERHAEHNAINNATFMGGTTMYITHPPCSQCQKLMDENHVIRAVWPGGEMEF